MSVKGIKLVVQQTELRTPFGIRTVVLYGLGIKSKGRNGAARRSQIMRATDAEKRRLAENAYRALTRNRRRRTP